MSEFKVGSVVTLKSGSPKMTVSSIDDEYLTLFWYEASQGDFVKAIFYKEMLQIITA